MASVMSMTGRGIGRASDSAGSVEVEISSVNRKQLDVVCALPREWTALEPDVLPVVREAISRGRVYCDFRFSPAPAVAKRYAAALRERVKEVCPADDERLLREIALFADRSDITEERVRIASHLDQAAALLRAGGPVGRKLDFLVQELGREINTVGSKANDETLSALVIDFKAELERIREQVQNLE